MVNEEVISKIIDKVTNSIPNFKHVEQVEACREYVDLAKPILPQGTYDDLCQLLLKRTHQMETELETFICENSQDNG